MKKELAVLDSLKSYEVARLIPTLPESKKEERATSLLLATFRVIPIYALSLLSEAGAPGGVRARIYGFTEIVPKSKNGAKLRPDGLVVVETGRSTWSAIIEAKIGNNQLSLSQLEAYIDLARLIGCEAIITISNQFATLPTHHPVSISKAKLGKLGLYHFSWLSLVANAVLLAKHREVDDPEQAFILDELIRYLQHPRSGVSLMTEMGEGWKSTCSQILQGMKLLKSTANVMQAVESWEQLTRYLALQLTLAVSKPVSIYLTRAESKDSEQRIRYQIDELISQQALSDGFEIPNAAGKLRISANFSRRALDFSMSVVSPKNNKFATAPINWLLRQIQSEDSNILIRASWPGRTPATMEFVHKLRNDASLILPQGCNTLPTGLEVVKVVDLAGSFQQKRKFVEIAQSELIKFYRDVGQHLRNWVPLAPKIKPEDKSQPADLVEEARIPDTGQVWAREIFDTDKTDDSPNSS